jgi:pimeloyl-ACP methyl ester carboxylesterase
MFAEGVRVHIVLVHGAGGTRATWSSVTPLLHAAGHTVSTSDQPSQSLLDDAAAVRSLIEDAAADVLLVGHSYGGAVITEAGRHPRVRGLVYIAAFAPGENESVDSVAAEYGPAEVFADREPDADGAMPGPGDDDWHTHSWDVPEADRLVAQTVRRTVCENIFTHPVGTPGWADRPSWYLVAAQDRHIKPIAQRAMAARIGTTVSEVETSHSVPHAAPERVAAVILAAAATLGSS